MPIRVLLVDDSVTVRRRLAEIIAGDPELELVAEAGDGKRAIELCRSVRPDVVSLDIALPVMSGLAVTEFIMAYCPTPIVIVTGSDSRGELFRTYDALAAGAVEVLEKPSGDGAERWDARFVSALKIASRIKVITHPRARLATIGRPLVALPDAPEASSHGPFRAVGIGASTGGPGAVLRVLRELSPAFPAPILLVIHIGGLFGSTLAEWLDGESPLRVASARDGEPLPGGGRVAIAPPGTHLVLERGRLRLWDGPERHSCRPSVDVLFESMAHDLGPGAAACVLTGMGRDGAAGMLAVRRAGGATLAQDEETSVVFGMPREAAVLGAAERVLPLDSIAPALEAIATLRSPVDGRRP